MRLIKVKNKEIVTIIKRLLIALFFISISRILIYPFNIRIWPQIEIDEFLLLWFQGLRFDLSTIFMLAGPFLFFYTLPIPWRSKKYYVVFLEVLFFLPLILGITVNFIDTAYFPFNAKRLTANIFDFLGAGDDFWVLLPSFLRDFWLAFLLWALSIFLLVRIKKWIPIRPEAVKKPFIWYYCKHSLIFISTIALSILGIRGGIQLRPIGINTAGYYASPANTPILLNSAFSIIKTAGHENIEYKNFFTDKELSNIYTPVQTYQPGQSALLPPPEQRSKNVVILILESFSSEHTGIFNKGKEQGKYRGYTPFLDSLMQHSLVFNGFANGKRSIEAIPSILASIPSLMNRSYILSDYSNNEINSLATILKKEAYHTSFFHGGSNGTMGFESFIYLAGFDDYFGRNEYNNDDDYDGHWGIFDEPYLHYFAEKLNTFPRPFLSALFTLSSHHPYTIPEEHKGKFKEGNLEIQKAIEYTDFSLGEFFKHASNYDWYNNTLFVITADHTSEAWFPEYQNRIGSYRVPIIFFTADGSLKGFREKIAQQTDIMPSILNYLGYKEDFIAFGQSVFDTSRNAYAISYLDNLYQLVQGDFVLMSSPETPFALYNYKEDPLLKRSLIPITPKRSDEMNHLLKAIVQQYNMRLLDNKLTIDNEYNALEN